MNDPTVNPPAAAPPPQSNQNATILLLGFLILLTSCALILAVRVHARLDGLTEAVQKLAATSRENTDAILKHMGAPAKEKSDAPTTPSPSPAKDKAAAPAKATTQRSPIPQPGEEITRPLPPVALAEKEPAKPLAPAPAEGEVVPWDQAHLHIGRTITTEGTIVDTKRLETICFLNFTNEQGGGDKFYLVVFKDQFDEWGGAPDQFFLGKTVRVTGEVELHKDRPQLKIKKKEQVLKVQ